MKKQLTPEQKIERAYQKVIALMEAAENEFEQRKVDRAVDRLAKMFESHEAFEAYWFAKINHTIKVK